MLVYPGAAPGPKSYFSYFVFYCLLQEILHGLLLFAVAVLLLLCLFSIVVVGTLGRAQCGRHSGHKRGEMGIG